MLIIFLSMDILNSEVFQIILLGAFCVVCVKMYLSHEYQKEQIREEEKTKRAERYARAQEAGYNAEYAASTSGFGGNEDGGDILSTIMSNPQALKVVTDLLTKKNSGGEIK